MSKPGLHRLKLAQPVGEAPLSEPERRDFSKICEDRYQVRSTILTVSRWHEQINDPTQAHGILDRLVQNATAL